ncbi:MAG: hypothetical protein ACI4MF_13865 [Candidatus Faecivicinus sp.]
MKKWIAALLAICLMTGSLLAPAAMAAEKNEIVYVNLRSGGDLDAVYIVNRFEASSPETVVDYGRYYKVTNLSDATPLEQNSDSVRLTVPAGTLFYQGDPISAALPWSFRVSYTLDGAPMRTEDLSGQSGALEMQITIGPGSEELTDFYEHYALNMTVTLDGNRCGKITAEGATIANSGTDRLLTYVVLPSPDVTYTITADVTDFAMVDISINGVPLGMDVDIDTSEIDDKVSELQNGVSQLSSGSSRLASGASSLKGGAAELQGGAVTLAEGTDSLVSGAAQFSAGLDEARAGSSELAAASAQIASAVDSFEEKTSGSPQMSIGELRSLCSAMLSAVSCQEASLKALQEKLSNLTATAKALESKAAELCDLISKAGFSDSDMSLLRTLLGRASGNSDVSTYLASEIAALGRILDSASAINSNLESIRSCAEESCSLAAALADPLGKLDSEITDALSTLAEVKTSLQSILDLLDRMEASGAGSNDDVMASLCALIRQMDAGVQALDSGIGELQANFALLSAGISSVDDGVDSLAAGTDTLLNGASSLSSGANSLKGGVNELSDGTSNMDEQVQEGVDEAISSITGGDYEPVSYADARNSVESVQFVIRVPGVSEAEEPEIVVEEEPEKSLGEKFLDLFR